MDNKQPIIRNAKKQDLEAILAVEKSAFAPERQASIETFQNRLQLFPQGFFVLIYNRKIVGLTTGLITEEINNIKDLKYSDEKLFKRQGNSYELRSLAVMKSYQGKGFGTLLAKRQVENAKNLKKKFFFFTATSDVEPFYLKLGFKKVGNYEYFHNSYQALWKIELDKFKTFI